MPLVAATPCQRAGSGLGDGDAVDRDDLGGSAVGGGVAPLVDLVDDLHAGHDVPEHRVGRGQLVATVSDGDEPLAAARVGLAGVGHGQGAGRVRVLTGRQLVGDVVPGAPGAGRGADQIAGLVHDAGDDAVEGHAVVEVVAGEHHEVVDRFGDRLGVELDDDLAPGGGEDRRVGLDVFDDGRGRRLEGGGAPGRDVSGGAGGSERG